MNDAPRPEPRRTFPVIGSPIDAIDGAKAIERISAWAERRESRSVFLCNVHAVVTARHDAVFAGVLRQADMALPDGEPVAWMLRRQGVAAQRRISGPDLMWAYCTAAAGRGESIYLLGASQATLDALQRNLAARFPGLHIAGACSPPFRPLTAEEDAAVVDSVNRSGAGTVWVSLGCPKQEAWIAAHRGRVRAVMLGVGAAFDFHAGSVPRAPAWMRNHGLEWLHRLGTEPRRLWKRYLVTNTLFVYHAGRQLLGRR